MPSSRKRLSKAPLSVLVLTHNSAATLRRCLASLGFASEVLVVDAGSGDATLSIAASFRARVVHQPWLGFTKQRNFGLSQCRHHWVLIVDSDEEVSPELSAEIQDLFKNGPDHQAYLIPERVRFLGRWLRWGGIYPGYHLTLFDRRKGSFAHGPGDVHEGAYTTASPGRLRHFKLHHAYPSFRLALNKLNRYTDLEAEGRYGQGLRSSLYGLIWRPSERFLKNYFLKLGFLDGIEGLFYASLTALYSFVIHVKLYELERSWPPAKID